MRTSPVRAGADSLRLALRRLAVATCVVATCVATLGTGVWQAPTASAQQHADPATPEPTTPEPTTPEPTTSVTVYSGPLNAAETRMARRVDRRSENRAIGRDVTIAILDEATNRLVFARRAKTPQRPASNMKVITALLALDALGPDHAFSTRVVAGARPNEIILQAGGDPLLRRENLRWLARKAAASLKRDRRVVLRVDDSVFAGPGRGPGWPSSYLGSVAGPVSSLALLGDRSRSRRANAIEAFRRVLVRKGFTVVVRGDQRAPKDARVLAQIAPHTVRQAIKVMLSESENNVAEVLFRHTAIASGQAPTWSGGRRAATALLRKLGIDTDRLRLMDGSGLSRSNRVTALALAQVARLSRIDPRFATMYAPGAMPTSGRSGTLDDRYGRYTSKPSRCARGKVRAKTGTLFDTIGLTGVTTARDGQEKAFSILVNQRPQRVSPLTTRRAVDGLAATINGCW